VHARSLSLIPPDLRRSRAGASLSSVLSPSLCRVQKFPYSGITLRGCLRHFPLSSGNQSSFASPARRLSVSAQHGVRLGPWAGSRLLWFFFFPRTSLSAWSWNARASPNGSADQLATWITCMVSRSSFLPINPQTHIEGWRYPPGAARPVQPPFRAIPQADGGTSFPVPFHHLAPTSVPGEWRLQLGDVSLRTPPVNHPVGVLAFPLEYRGQEPPPPLLY